MNHKKDLTRWNRAGTQQFRYIDGNAITHLEDLRRWLNDHYNSGIEPQWQELIERFPVLANETLLQKNKRISAQYYDERRDLAWEILRSFARSTHVLTEYIDAYANEAYLPTAKQWDHVRQLVALLGYQPSPPASARTDIAILLKDSQSGEIAPGFSVKNVPAKGESTIIFETTEKIQANESLNSLHLNNWDKNPQKLTQLSVKGRLIRYTLTEVIEDISVGDVGVLSHLQDGVAIEVTAVMQHQQYTELILKHSPHTNIDQFSLADTTLYLDARFIEQPLPHGSGSVSLQHSVSLIDGETVFINGNATYHTANIEHVQGQYIQFQEPPLVAINDNIIRPQKSNHQYLDKFPSGSDSGHYFMLSGINHKNHLIAKNQQGNSITSDRIVHHGDTDSYYVKKQSGDGQAIYYVNTQQTQVIAQVAEVHSATIESLSFSGKSAPVSSDQWLWSVDVAGKTTAYQINSVVTQEQQFTLNISSQHTITDRIALVQGDFTLVLKHQDHDINKEPIWHANSNDEVTIVTLDDPTKIHHLSNGQTLIIADQEHAEKVEIAHLVGAQIHLKPAFHQKYPNALGFNKHNTVIYGNVVSANHGETQVQKILGNGDASQTHQSFVVPSEKISWVADEQFSAGVRADIVIHVNNRQWQQVQNLSHSGPEDHHYHVRINENNRITVHFGDGRGGRKLPTGLDNVRVVYREGYGESGNLDAHALSKIAKPNPLIKDFIAPLPATGGADKEAVEHMRDNAPAALLTLQRAVSIKDFEHLASQHSMIWQARAFEKMPNRPAPMQVDIVAVAAGGEVFNKNSETATDLRKFFSKHSLPDVPIKVRSYQSLVMHIAPKIMVDVLAYDGKKVAESVKAHLQEQLNLKNRALGQGLLRSDLLALIEQVEGVENTQCVIHGVYHPTTGVNGHTQIFTGVDGEIRRVDIKPDQLLYLDAGLYSLNVIVKPYQR